MNTLEPYGHSLDRRPPAAWRRPVGRALAWSPGAAAALTLTAWFALKLLTSEAIPGYPNRPAAMVVLFGALVCLLALPISIGGLVVIPPKRKAADWVFWLLGLLAVPFVLALILATTG